jgi:hypothetical protein
MKKRWFIAKYNDLGFYAGNGALLKVMLDEDIRKHGP